MTTTQPVDAIVARIREAVDKIPQPAGAWHKSRQTIDIDESEEWPAVRVQVYANKLVGPKVATYIDAAQPAALAALLAHIDGLALKAARYDWLAPRLIGADFDWNESGKCALVFEWPSNVAVGGSCDQNLDAAMTEGAGT